MRIRYWAISFPPGSGPPIGPTEVRHAPMTGIDNAVDRIFPRSADVARARSTGWIKPPEPAATRPGTIFRACHAVERVTSDERNVTAASGGHSDWQGDHVLSDRSRPVIEATLPAVAANIEEIATRFYDHLFGEHPELLDGTFNRGNQAEKTQQMALAASVAVFASSLVKVPEQLPEHLLNRIAHKHASLGITPAQYEVVHDNLFWAIVDVLGDAVTPEVAAAWDEVYWLMAYALINQERGLYSARGVRAETVWREWEVAERIEETPDVVTFRVRRSDDRLVRTSLPGQYVTVQVPMPDGVRQPRQYSLTRADDGDHRQFSVKRVRGGDKPDGEVSNFLYNHVHVGDRLTMSLPFGDVVLDDSRPVVFASAGIGITPMAGMLSHLAAARSRLPIMLLHADADESSFALRRQVLA